MSEPQSGEGGTNPSSASNALSDEQLKQVSKVVNSAISGRISGIEQKLGSQIEAGLGSVVKQLQAQQSQAGSGGGAGGGEAKPETTTPEILTKGESIEDKVNAALAFQAKQHKRDMEAMHSKVSQIEQEREKEKSRAQDLLLREATVTALNKLGVTGTHQTVALNQLHASQLVRFDEENRPVYHDAEMRLNVSLDQGLAEWLKSDIGQVCTPKTKAAGSGDGPKASERGNDRKAQARALLMKAISPS